jgi:hypothetical protein
MYSGSSQLRIGAVGRDVVEGQVESPPTPVRNAEKARILSSGRRSGDVRRLALDTPGRQPG